MSQAHPDEKLVYLALRKAFANEKPPLSAKSIKTKVQGHEAEPQIHALLQKHGIDSICKVAKTLVDDGIYFSPEKAKQRFHETGSVRQAQSAECCTTKAGAADPVVEAHPITANGSSSVVTHPSAGKQPPASLTTGKVAKPTLFPVYLPVRVQVRLLARTQRLLEHVCYNFTKQHMPDVLQSRDWECAESIELNLWSQWFTTSQHKIAKQILAGFKPCPGFWESIVRLRHAAVHRERFTAEEVERFLINAETLCALFEALDPLDSISHSRHTMLLFVGEMKRNKDLLENQAEKRLGDLARQKKELERQEKLVVSEMLKKDEKNKKQLGENLEEMLGLGLDDSEIWVCRRDNVCSTAATVDEELSRYDTDHHSLSKDGDEAATVKTMVS